MVETKRILVMSDTHGLKQDDITKIIEKENCDYNIHCGDYLYDFDYMKEHFDYFVDGNNDVKHGYEYNSKTFTICGFKFFLFHGNQLFWHPYHAWIKHLFYEAHQQNVDVLLFGHSHTYLVQQDNQHIIIANPGSITMGRHGKSTYMIITIKNREINFEEKVPEFA